MIFKRRCENSKVRIYRQLYYRGQLSKDEILYYSYLEKGFLGELAFDALVDHLDADWLILNDLQLEVNYSSFQIDKVIITPTTIYLIEIKNYEGDYYIDGEHWYSTSKLEIKNPLTQLKRSESFFRRLLHGFSSHLPIKSYLVFINPKFYLYNAPLELPIIFPTQTKRFIDQITNTNLKLKNTHNEIATKLSSMHQKDIPYINIPPYKYKDIKRGTICPSCFRFYSNRSYIGYFFCDFCNSKEKLEDAVIRSIEEFNVLFPELPITSTRITDWCQVVSKRYLQKLLPKKFQLIKHGRSSYYV